MYYYENKITNKNQPNEVANNNKILMAWCVLNMFIYNE